MNVDYAAFLAGKSPKPIAYGIEPEPMPDCLLDFAAYATAFCIRQGRAALFLDTGLTKALASDTPVITPSGMVPIGQLKVGQKVIGANGKPTEVTGVYPQGTHEGYKVTFSDDASLVCDADHLWAVRSKVQKYRREGWDVVPLSQIIDRGIRPADNLFIPMTDPVDFEDGELCMHPYLLGCLIGDGGLTRPGVTITIADIELIDRLSGLLPLTCEIEKKKYSLYDYTIRGRHEDRREKNEVLESLSTLGLMGKGSPAKFIPECYKFSSIETRLHLLQGLMDTDGCIHLSHGCPVVFFSSSSRKLTEDVLFVVQSLGGKGRIRSYKTTHLMAHRLVISLPHGFNPFWLPRKASLYRERQKYMPARSFRKIEPVGMVDMTCISVAADDGLFLAEHFIVTHNTRCQLEFIRQGIGATNGFGLILTPLAVTRQIETEGISCGYNCRVVRDASEVKPGINICNYDRLDKLDVSVFGAVSLDESDVLKNFTGKTTRALIAAFADTPFRLCATATPAPNDHIELGTHAEFLGIMPQSDMLLRWFINDTSDTGTWRLKGHARKEFWDWCASWAVMASSPEDLGFDGSRFVLPPLRIVRHKVSADITPTDGLFSYNVSATEIFKLKRQTAEVRAEKTAAIVAKEPNEPWLIWVDTDAEQDAVKRILPRAIDVRGSMTPETKEEGLIAFLTSGRPLITKGRIAGSGLNFQHCARQIFVGRSYSYRDWYQMIRRSWRFGQKREVVAHLVVAEGEDQIGRVLDMKADLHSEMKAEMIAASRRKTGRIHEVKIPYNPTFEMELPNWLR
jgi:hypothetical protein